MDFVTFQSYSHHYPVLTVSEQAVLLDKGSGAISIRTAPSAAGGISVNQNLSATPISAATVNFGNSANSKNKGALTLKNNNTTAANTLNSATAALNNLNIYTKPFPAPSQQMKWQDLSLNVQAGTGTNGTNKISGKFLWQGSTPAACTDGYYNYKVRDNIHEGSENPDTCPGANPQGQYTCDGRITGECRDTFEGEWVPDGVYYWGGIYTSQYLDNTSLPSGSFWSPSFNAECRVDSRVLSMRGDIEATNQFCDDEMRPWNEDEGFGSPHAEAYGKKYFCYYENVTPGSYQGYTYSLVELECGVKAQLSNRHERTVSCCAPVECNPSTRPQSDMDCSDCGRKTRSVTCTGGSWVSGAWGSCGPYYQAVTHCCKGETYTTGCKASGSYATMLPNCTGPCPYGQTSYVTKIPMYSRD